MINIFPLIIFMNKIILFIYYLIAIYFFVFEKIYWKYIGTPIVRQFSLHLVSHKSNENLKPHTREIENPFMWVYFKSCLWVYKVYTPTSLEVEDIYRHQNFVELYEMRHFLMKSMTIWKVPIIGNILPNELNTLCSLGQV